MVKVSSPTLSILYSSKRRLKDAQHKLKSELQQKKREIVRLNGILDKIKRSLNFFVLELSMDKVIFGY